MGNGRYVRTVLLADGGFAGKIYELGKRHFRLDGFGK